MVGGIDRYVASHVFPDWYVDSILRGLITERYVVSVSPAVLLIVTRSHLQQSRPLRGLTCCIPDRYAVSPAALLTVRGLTCGIPDRYAVSPVPYVVSSAVFLTVTRSQPHIPDHYVHSPVVFLTVTRSQPQYS